MPLIGDDGCTHSGLRFWACNSSFVDCNRNVGTSGYQLAGIEPSDPHGCAVVSFDTPVQLAPLL